MLRGTDVCSSSSSSSSSSIWDLWMSICLDVPNITYISRYLHGISLWGPYF